MIYLLNIQELKWKMNAQRIFASKWYLLNYGKLLHNSGSGVALTFCESDEHIVDDPFNYSCR